jgi:outer membrane protein OmpA-like peptidoglycan-associated protein
MSLGEANPKYDNSKEETRKLNRRAALVVDNP